MVSTNDGGDGNTRRGARVLPTQRHFRTSHQVYCGDLASLPSPVHQFNDKCCGDVDGTDDEGGVAGNGAAQSLSNVFNLGNPLTMSNHTCE